jgi:exonuclease I
MAKTSGIEWFGADIEERETDRVKSTEAQFHGFKGVDADVPRNVRQPDGTVATVMVRKPAPKYLRAVTTSAKDAEIARLTARYKMLREGFRFAPLDDKEMWETRRDIAFAEMQLARFRQKLARYESQPNPRPEQVQLYKNIIAMWRGRFAELTHQD